MRALATLALLLAACGTHADEVCEDVGLCRGLTDDQVSACQTEAKSLTVEARALGCGAQAAAFFDCGASHYTCAGDTPGFPGCDASRAALDSCVAGTRAQNACGRLDARLSACPSVRPPSAVAPAACGTAQLCASQCFLAAVADVCRAQAAELLNFARCVQQCP